MLTETQISTPAAIISTTSIRTSPQGPGVIADQPTCDHQPSPVRYHSDLLHRIRTTWRNRQSVVRAETRLILAAKADCRRYCRGDKKDGTALYNAIVKGTDHPMREAAHKHVVLYRAAMAPLIKARAQYEREMMKLGKELPIAHMAERIRGINTLTLAKIAAECGDLSVYEKGIAGIWKRAGLAVIDGERQRRVPGDAALLHGYDAERRAVFWNIGEALLKSQGKDETAGPYRLIYDERKAYERPRVESDGHAHNRACRFMLKRLLKHLWQEWCFAAK